MNSLILKRKNRKNFPQSPLAQVLKKPNQLFLLLLYSTQTLKLINPRLISNTTPQSALSPFALSGVNLPNTLIRKQLSLVPTENYSSSGRSGVNFSRSSTKPLHKLFLLFLRMSFKNTSFFFKAHFSHRLIFNLNTRDDLISLNTTTLFARWKNFYDLLTNILFMDLKTFFLGSRFLWGEIVANNWLNFKSKSILRWTLARSFFFYDHKPNLFSGLTFDRLLELEPDFIFLLDMQQHRKHLFFLKPYPIYLIGLVPAYLNPWELNYPIPVFNASLLVQYYFIKLYFTTLRLVKYINYSKKKRLWRTLSF